MLSKKEARKAIKAIKAHKIGNMSFISFMSLVTVIILQSLIPFSASAQAHKLNLIPSEIPLIDSFQNDYPEEANKKIIVYKEKSPLALNQNELSILDNISEFYNSELVGDIREQVTNFGFNKFSFGTGVVDVTFQVKDGVKYALKDTFAGYLEYERRKIAEEFLNANLEAHKLTENFLGGAGDSNIIDLIANIFGNSLDGLTGFKFSNLITLTKQIINQNICNDLMKIFQYIAFALMTIFAIMRIVKNFKSQTDDSLSKTVMDTINCFLLIQFMPNIIDVLFDLLAFMQAMILTMIDLHVLNLKADYNSLERSWENIANNFGYMPAMILSILDSCAQILVYFFVLGLILFIIIGKILSPLWSLALMSLSLRANFLDNLLAWCRNLFALTLIPLIFLIINLIAHELSDINNGIFEVICSIAGFVFLPFSLNLLKTKSSNVLEPVFMGYSQSLESIRDAINNLRYGLQK